MWDQRCWHRRTAFTPQEEGELRVVSIFGFQAIDHYPHWGEAEMTMPASLARKWAAATTQEDIAYFGGKWSAHSVVAALAALPPEAREELMRRAEQLGAPRL